MKGIIKEVVRILRATNNHFEAAVSVVTTVKFCEAKHSLSQIL